MSRLTPVFALLLMPTMAFAQSPRDKQFAADVDAFVARVMALDPTPGLAIAVVKGDQVVLTKGYGWADVERQVPATENTAFYIASMTKAFTALDVALLAQQGKLSLDAPISRYLGDVTWGTGVNADSITLRQLLSHTHGITNDGPVVFRTAFTGDHTNAVLKNLLRYHSASSAGHAYRYTNLGYNIAGIILDDVTKSKWQDQLAVNVFKPLAMNSTTAYISRLDSARLAMPYAALTKRIHFGKADANMQAAGGLVSTATDMARWLAAQINLGRIDGKQVFPRAVMAETHRIQAPITAKNEAGAIGYTLGWNVSIVNGDTVLHHGGGFSTFGSYIAFSPMSKVGVAIMVNSNVLGGQAMNMIVDYVLDRGVEVEGWRDKYEQRLNAFAGRLPQARVSIAADRAKRAERPQTLPQPLEAYAGTYDNPEAGTMIWTVRDGRLWVQFGVLKSIADVYDSATSKLRAELEPGVGEVFAFEIENGKAVSLKYSGRTFTRRN
jgi:CubicO group peptidase (beta-lactamase class C family)